MAELMQDFADRFRDTLPKLVEVTAGRLPSHMELRRTLMPNDNMNAGFDVPASLIAALVRHKTERGFVRRGWNDA